MSRIVCIEIVESCCICRLKSRVWQQISCQFVKSSIHCSCRYARLSNTASFFTTNLSAPANSTVQRFCRSFFIFIKTCNHCCVNCHHAKIWSVIRVKLLGSIAYRQCIGVAFATGVMSHVAWSVCLFVCVCWSLGCAVQKRLSQLRCCVGGWLMF